VNAATSTSTSEEGKHHAQAFPQILPTVAAHWSHVGYPENPHDCLASRGWHGIGCCARWNITQIIRDFGSTLQFSECRSDTDPPDVPLEMRWESLTFSPSKDVVVLIGNASGFTWHLSVWAPTHEIAERESCPESQGE
jgi:hypothetical protein